MVPLTAAAIAQSMPILSLNDLLAESNPDIENDLHVLLHWLHPYYPLENHPVQEPLARTRAAARNCLKDTSAQAEFVRLWLNSIRTQFHGEFSAFVAQRSLSDVLRQVTVVSKYLTRQCSYLNLLLAAAGLFRQGVNALFVRYLLLDHVVCQLREYLARPELDLNSLSLSTLSAVGMADTVQAIMADITIRRIHSHVTQTAAGSWNKPVLAEIQEWVRIDLFPGFVQGCQDASDLSCSELIRISHDELIHLRTSEIYDLVLAFPHSEVALNELHTCLVYQSRTPDVQTQHRSQLVEAFINKCNLRLLHLGANTDDVILTYSQTIKAFLIIDPTGVLLDKVARPIRRYLKTRTNLVLRLVQGMLDLTANNRLLELAHELHKNKRSAPTPIDDLTDVHWVPDPIDALPDFKKGKVSDVVEALISIFPLTEVFVEEFTRLFGERLLQWDKYPTSEIVRDVELLKARFGPNEFATLDVMVKDIHDSEEVNSRLQLPEFELTILSKMYWPTVCDSLSENDYFVVPVEQKFASFQDQFKHLKTGRGLKLIPSMGTVKLELGLKTGTREFSVTPAQAAVINVFNETEDAFSVGHISIVTGLTEYLVSQALRFWQSQGVLRELDGKYILNE